MATRQDAVNFAAKEYPYAEGPNNDTKYGRWYGMNHQPWCAMFVSYVLAFCGNPLPAIQIPGKPGAASVWLVEQWFKKMGLWTTHEADGEPGDFVIYTFSHIGILEGLDTVHTDAVVWEGNTDVRGGRTGGQILRQRRDFGIIKGICKVPNYQASTAPPPPPQNTAPAWPGRYLSLTTPYTRGEDVRTLQRRMQQFGSSLTADGVFGPATWNAVRWWQGVFGLIVDGVVGPATWTRFFR